MNKERFFAFGCSYTNWPDNPTWADFIGVNFKEYYNFGKPGACNTFIMQKIYEIDELLNFNSETDFIIVALTGFGRFTYLEPVENLRYPEESSEYNWATNGDILFGNDGHPEVAKLLKNKIYNWPWAAYNSWFAFTAIKQFLSSKNIEHKIIMAIDNSHFINEAYTLGLQHRFENIGSIVPKIKNLYKKLDSEFSIDFYRKQNASIYEPMGDTLAEHPIKQIYYDYIEAYFPELITQKSKELLNISNDYWKSMIEHRITKINNLPNGELKLI